MIIFFFNACQIFAAFFVILIAFASSNLHAEWVLDNILIPDGFSLKVNHRARYEFLNNDFRAGNASPSFDFSENFFLLINR